MPGGAKRDQTRKGTAWQERRDVTPLGKARRGLIWYRGTSPGMADPARRRVAVLGTTALYVTGPDIAGND